MIGRRSFFGVLAAMACSPSTLLAKPKPKYKLYPIYTKSEHYDTLTFWKMGDWKEGFFVSESEINSAIKMLKAHNKC